MDPKLKFYIAGKITGDPEYREKFGRVEAYIRELGGIALNPALLPDGLSQGDYMRICFAMLDCADGIVLLPDWEESEGARLERAYAKKVGKPAAMVDALRKDKEENT